MDQRLVEAEAEMGKLKLDVDDNELLFLLGGYDGENWLSTLDSYSPTNDVIRSLKPMSCIRSHASVAKLNGEIYAIGGGNGYLWYDTVESYDPAKDQWTMRPSLSTRKGSVASCTLNDKIFAFGGGNRFDWLAVVEMLDLEAGEWIFMDSMMEQRFAPAAVALNGAIYVTGGYNGRDYLRTAERFDPREHSWRKIEDLTAERGCHSMVVLNGKIYAIGGHNHEYYNGSVYPDVEIYDPRLGSWMEGEPMNQQRSYSATVVLNESIYVIGGLDRSAKLVDTVEFYKEGEGWRVADHNAVGKRAFASAIVM